MSFLKFLLGINQKKDYSNYTKKELEKMGFEDWQIDLIKSGEYEPYDFEEESTDEDSYYNEDD